MNRKMNFIDWLAIILLVIGGLNWGLVGLFGFDLVAAIFGSMTLISRVVYSLVGLSGLYVALMPLLFGSMESVSSHTAKGI
jgi:uncharacterized protein